MTALDALPRRGEHAVVVVAHPDDESFGCGSLIARAVDVGARVTVICATRGEAGERVPDAATDHLSLGDVRERELRAAAAVLGASSVIVLGLGDSGFDGPLADNMLCAVPAEDVAALIRTALGNDHAEVLITIDGSDGHRDHVRIRDAVDHLAATSTAPIRVVQYCLARSLMVRWVEEMQTINPDAPYHEIDLDAIGRADGELTPVDSTTYLPDREAAIACHLSQHSPFDRLSPGLRAAFLSTDHIVAV